MREFSKEEIINACKKSILFKSMDLEKIKYLLNIFNYNILKVKKGDLLFSEGDNLDYISIVLEGEMISCKYLLNGSESILSNYKRNNLIGLDILCTPLKKSFYTVYAIKDTCLLNINKNMFEDQRLCDNDKLIIYRNIIGYLGNKNAKKCHKIEIISQKSIRSRIINYLIIQKANNGSSKFKISFDRGQLASYLCVNRSVLSHELSLMQKEGIIKFNKNEFEIFI